MLKPFFTPVLICFALLVYLTEASNENFRAWKNAKEKEWTHKEKHAEELKQSDLLRSILTNQEMVQKNPEDCSAQEELIFSYNYLREKRGLSSIDEFTDADTAWLFCNQCKILEQANNQIIEVEGMKTHLAKTIAAKKIYLLHEVIAELNTFYHQPHNKANNAWLLCDYNQLRKLANETPINSLKEIDKNWLEDIKLKIWKERAEEPLTEEVTTGSSSQSNNIPSKFQQHYNLMSSVYDALSSSESERGINAYNSLRELYNKPLIYSSEDINTNWLQETAREILREEGFIEPSLAQKKMAQEVQSALRLTQKVLVTHDIHHPEHSRVILHPLLKEGYVVALGKNPDLNDRLFYIYHELGHLVNDDLLHKKQVHKGEKSYTDLLNLPEFKKDIGLINYYKELAAHTFDESTSLGKHITKILKDYPNFWIPPADEQLKTKLLYFLGTEKRADLFAIKHLYKQNKLNAILNSISNYARGNRRGIGFLVGMHPIVLDNRKVFDIHPSDFERALYMAGFLVDKGVDINAAFKEWEEKGTCIAAEQYYEEKYKTCPNSPVSII